jgi:riboflavin biosynthesis pyrimidine reductase
MVVLSGGLDLPIAGRALGSTEQARVVATAARAPAERRAALEARGVEVLVCGEEQPEPARVVAALAARGWREIVVEGGGGVNAAFLDARLVDEMYVTIAPAILGGRTLPTLVDGPARAQAERLRLALVEATPQPTGEIFTRWRVLQ